MANLMVKESIAITMVLFMKELLKTVKNKESEN